ncbi:integumentary mucin C.1-like [Saccostrea cucullata]|uniref:integumentary mucin C.1-like n=1 Tax=Saccostrea cuccullata TaxID=36930 RepID=UPI002ED2C304
MATTLKGAKIVSLVPKDLYDRDTIMFETFIEHFLLEVTTSTSTTTKRSTTTKITSTPNTTERATTTTTTSTSTTKSPSTTTGTKPAIPCPVCDEALQCNWNRTCLPETQTCMIRSYVGYKFTVHCSMADDCQFIQSELDSGEIFCCNDRQCLSTYLGI